MSVGPRAICRVFGQQQGASKYETLTNGSQVDSARMYRNEGPVSNAMRKSGLPRDDLFFTTKIPPGEMGYGPTKQALEASFKETKLDYFDL